ncbi:conserved hypothetical protein [Beggiatoa sp. PS]|nr:conserved hypothetical protein [Beggiatoa sp. PS]
MVQVMVRNKPFVKLASGSISLRYGTAYYDLDVETTLFEIAIRAFAEGNSIRATARILQVDKDTACDWLHRAARHCRIVMLYLWQNLHVTSLQLDELWSFILTLEHNCTEAKLYHESYGDAWVWLAFAPVWRVVLAFVIGSLPQKNANLLLDRVAHVTDAHIPFFTSDQFSSSRTALLHTYGQWYQPPRKGNRGRYPKPLLVEPSELVYAQVVKIRNSNGRLIEVKNKIIFGDENELASKLAESPVRSEINTSFIERDNLTQRQSNRRLTRRSNGFSKELSWFDSPLWLSLAYYHLVLPHQSLRQKLLNSEPTLGTGYQRCWQPRTPAMAASITDHIWTTSELLSYRVPAPFIDELPQLEYLFPNPDKIHQGS